MKGITSLVIVVALVSATSSALAQQPLAADAEAAAFEQLAASLPLGARIKLQSRDGQRMTATLIAVEEDAVIVQRESRVPEPAMRIPFAQLTRLQRADKSGFSLGKAIGMGLAAGVGAILTLFAIAVSVGD